MSNLYAQFKPIQFQLSPSKENEILQREAASMASEINKDVLAAFPNYQTSTMKLPDSKTRLGMYTQQTTPEDFPLLHDPDYLAKYKAGLYPQPVSPFWNGLLGLPPVFEHVQKDFNKVFNTLVGGS